MHYVYLLESSRCSDLRYVGMTSDLKTELAQLNAGQSPPMAEYLPWRLVTYLAFSSLGSAAKFERYLKSDSGQAFAKKRLWSDAIDPVEKFRKQVCFSSFMKSELRKVQRDICPVCRMPLWKRRIVIHHRDYGHRCGWPGTVFVKVAGREVEAPDCGQCQEEDAGRFESCRRRLQLLHRGCHADFHAAQKTMPPVA